MRCGRRSSSPCAASTDCSTTDPHTTRSSAASATSSGRCSSALGEPLAGEADLTGKLRGLLVGAQGVLGGDVGVQARCREWFDAPGCDPTSVDPELTAAATSVVAATGDADTYARMRAGVVASSTNPQEQLRHLYALAEFDDEAAPARHV